MHIFDSGTSPEMANVGIMSFRYSNKLYKSVSLLLVGQFAAKLEQFKELPRAAANLNCIHQIAEPGPNLQIQDLCHLII